MRRNHPYRQTMLAISRRMQRSGYSVSYTKHGDPSLGVPDPPAGAAWIQFTEQEDCQGFEHALGKLNMVESVRKRGRTCFELPEERGAACVVEAGDGTGYLYLSELGPVEEVRAVKLGTLLETIRGGGPRLEAEPLEEARSSRPGMTRFRDLTLRKKVVDQIMKAIMAGVPIAITGKAGAGKSMIARRIAQMMKGPLRVPHYSVSLAGLIGSKRSGDYRPGELVLANNGTLMLDEAPEFARVSLEAVGNTYRNKRVVDVQLPPDQAGKLDADFHLVLTSEDNAGAKRALKLMNIAKAAIIPVTKGDLAVGK